MLVVRVEHPLDGYGLFRSHNSMNFDGLEKMYDRHQDLPIPTYDGLSMYKDNKQWFCAYKTLEQFKEWVTTEEVQILLSYGFNIYMLEVEEFQQGNYQVLFTKRSITSYKIINSLFKT